MSLWKRIKYGLGALFSGLMFLFKPLLLHKMKVFTRTQVGSYRSTGRFITVNDFIGERDVWKKTKNTFK